METEPHRYVFYCAYISVDHLSPPRPRHPRGTASHLRIARRHRSGTFLRFHFHSCHSSFSSCVPLCLPAAHCADIQSFIRALRALRHPENESTMQSHDPGRSALCLSTVIDIPPEVTYCETPQCDKDYVRRYRAQTNETAAITRLGTTIEEAKERRLDEEQDQSGMTVNTPAPTQRPSIDVVCHI